ncbi:MAG: hypothetical protein Q4G03_10405 [Planctomycetia bacterium]|nr:hypothetical protein [Planctomycetia bacterium]
MEEFLTMEFLAPVGRLLRMIFFWSGFAALVGLLVALVVPAERSASSFRVFGLGMVGVTIGSCVGRTIFHIESFDPVSPAGVVFAIVAAIIALLAFYVFTFFVSTSETPEFNEQEEAYLQKQLANCSRQEVEDILIDLLHEYPETYDYVDRTLNP